MTDLRYLDAAPPELIDLHRRAEDSWSGYMDDRVRMKSIAMLGRLVSNLEMVDVWRRLLALSRKRGRSASYGLGIFSAAQNALVLLEAPRRSKKDEERLFSEISNLIGDLNHRIQEAQIFGSCQVEEFMTAKELNNLSELMRTPVRSSLNDSRLSRGFTSDAFVETRVATWGVIPSLTGLLTRFEEATKRRTASTLWKQPNAPSAGNNVFALCISEHVYEQYKRYLDDLVGTFTTVALDIKEGDEITGALVQQLRMARNSSIPKSG